MSETTDDKAAVDYGGPAFPNFEAADQRGYGGKLDHLPMGGMSLRDYFAAKAMQGMLAYSPADPKDNYLTGACTPSVMASHAYEMADAMIAVRKR